MSIQTGAVLGASTTAGAVLGASVLAETGITEYHILIGSIFSVLIVSTVVILISKLRVK